MDGSLSPQPGRINHNVPIGTLWGEGAFLTHDARKAKLGCMEIARALSRFPEVPVGAATAARPCSDGLINATWLIGDAFVLQRVNPIFGAAVNQDILALTTHLRASGVPVPRLLLADDGQPFVDDAGIWRVMTRLPGRTIHRLEAPVQAERAAGLVARFHSALSESDHRFAFTRPGAHDTPAHMRRLQEAVAVHSSHRLVDEVAPLAREIVARWEALPAAAPLPRRIVHGDLKISNVLFDEGDQAAGLIDLDTMAWSDLEVEMGDALRSWCSTTTEDAPNPALDIAIFEAAVTGYARAAGGISAEESQAFVRGMERITLELSARFAADALNESYFGWSQDVAPTRGEHNLLRAINQLSLARQVAVHRGDLHAISGGVTQ